MKKHFSVFEGLSFGEKIKIWQKIADTSFNDLRSSEQRSWIINIWNHILTRVCLQF